MVADSRPACARDDAEGEVCPVCLECLAERPLLRMPVCQHPIHVTCALGAAQYDVRCPVCRTQDPTIETKQDRDTRLFDQLEEYAQQQERIASRHQRRRADVIRTHPSLSKIRNRMRENERLFVKLDKELDRTWSRLQRRMWSEHETVVDMRRQRNRARNRYNADRRKLDARLAPLIGEAPELTVHIV